MNAMDRLSLLSPVDGRYYEQTGQMAVLFSEEALYRDRMFMEIEWLMHLAKRDIVPMNLEATKRIEKMAGQFATDDMPVLAMATISKQVKHDNQAVVEYLRNRLQHEELEEVASFVHFGLTGDDIENIVYARALSRAREILRRELDAVIEGIERLMNENSRSDMLARTHGQPALPTTFGHELLVFIDRLYDAEHRMEQHYFAAKMNGAVGTWAALRVAAPNIDWLTVTREFVSPLGLDYQPITTQSLPYDNWLEFFSHVQRANSVLIGFCQDMWSYISRGLVRLDRVEGETGSSAMPQKVNPIHFENAEGNLGVANAMLTFYQQKLPISRLQRDLSDSTVRRTFGTTLAHTLLAYRNTVEGLHRTQADPMIMRSELAVHWETLAEAVQTILRCRGYPFAYNWTKSYMRGLTSMTVAEYRTFVHDLCETHNLPNDLFVQLNQLEPWGYTGYAREMIEDTE